MKRGLPPALAGRVLLVTCFAALVAVIAMSLASIDSWLLHMTVWQAVVKLAVRLVWALALASLVAGIGIAVSAAICLLGPKAAQAAAVRMIGRIADFFAALTVLTSLLWLLLSWFASFGAAPLPNLDRMALMLALGSLGAGLLWRRRRAWIWKQIDENIAGPASRRMVLATGGAAMVVAATRLLPGKTFAPVVKAADAEHPNIILVTFDALSAGDMSLYGRRLVTTPSIDSFARQAVVFDKYFSGSTFTGPCIATMLSGRYPSSTRVFQQGARIQDGAERNLIEVLRRAGYDTAATVANIAALPDAIGIEDSFSHATRFPLPGRDFLRGPLELVMSVDSKKAMTLMAYRNELEQMVRGTPASDGSVRNIASPAASFDQALEMLGKLTPPYFLWIHVYAPHQPYQPASPYAGQFLPGNAYRSIGELKALVDAGPQGMDNVYALDRQGEVDQARLRYDEYLLEADAAFGAFLRQLENRGLGNPALIVSADHGESFSGGVFGHGSSHLVQPIIQVPLIIRRPGLGSGRRSGVVADQTALAPTIMEIAGVKAPAWLATPHALPLSPSDPSAGFGLAYTQYLEGNSAFRSPRSGVLGVTDGTFQYVFDLKSRKGAFRRLGAGPLDIPAGQPDTEAFLAQSLRARFPHLFGGGG
jgi:arylsulfatase A-like enzyme